MFERLGTLVTRHWLATILVWIVAVVLLRWLAPTWREVAYDGDFAFLPSGMPSVVGEKLLTEAFPHERAKSQIVVLFARDHQKLTADDLNVAKDLVRRMKNIQGAANLAQAMTLGRQAEGNMRDAGPDQPASIRQRRTNLLQTAQEAFNEAVFLDEELADHWSRRVAEDPQLRNAQPPRLAEAYHNRAQLHRYLRDTESEANDRQSAAALQPELASAQAGLLPDWAGTFPLIDSWTWHNDVFGPKLVSRDGRALLVILQLTNEFMATDNLDVMQRIDQQLAAVRQDLDRRTSPGLSIGISGSAAVGGDLLRSAANSIRHTELATLVLVILILGLIYRSPLLILVPLLSIGVAFATATGVLTLLTQLHRVPGFSWWDFKVFTTTRIFVVVILFGGGTDYCLFLIARYKELLSQDRPPRAAVAAALSSVGDALAASALTTILGLGMMYFAQFGKFHFSGPVIGLSLAVTLLVCLTLTPALLCGLGPAVFWPFGKTTRLRRVAGVEQPSLSRSGHHPLPASQAKNLTHSSFWTRRFWEPLARGVVRRPGLILVGSVVLMLPLAVHGVQHGDEVTYDFLNELDPSSPSRRGAELMRQHFPVGESGPLTVLVGLPQGGLDSRDGRAEIRALSDRLFLPGIAAVRSGQDPLGELQPGERPGLIGRRGMRLRVLRVHRRTKMLFEPQTPQWAGRLARFELLLRHDPFSLEAVRTVSDVERRLEQISADRQSFWHGSQIAFTGTTAAIRDLRAVTQADQKRIQILVVLAVYGVLIVILRRPLIALYMVLSVLFSYLVTLGATTALFAYAYGDSYQGLDWKVPLFLFVILVAIGQDYNVYLTTRVLEEQRRHGPFGGLRRAVVRTGGIITSCGLIMAGTLISMTCGSWIHLLANWVPLVSATEAGVGNLRAITELGIALAMGVLLDTFIVRSILLPAFLALLARWKYR